MDIMPTLKEGSVDAVITDPPYGIFIKDASWDMDIPPIDIWKECLRVLKPGAFAFVMSSARQDVLARMLINLKDAGFDIPFSSIYWTYKTGFTKARGLSGVIDRRAGIVQKTSGYYIAPDGRERNYNNENDHANKVFSSGLGRRQNRFIWISETEKAKEFEGAYSGFQLKPAVEVIIIAMKPLSKESFVDQALANGHGCTWQGNCRIPLSADEQSRWFQEDPKTRDPFQATPTGRYPTNLLVEDKILDENSKYFSLDAWFESRLKLLPKQVQKTFPFLVVSKPPEREKKANLDSENIHLTLKPIKLISWLITLATREGDIVLDPFLGSGTTHIAANALGRFCIGIEKEKKYYDMALKHINMVQKNINAYF